ncbi:hypothetical protein A8C56_13650 [Niabella ginsenosidivorans]|uniref:Uncharacterized protein n=1 Tax=Niabella ginsenosidivorans TaxID=1176587 RepID=A0A1A9I496_9BACT|nr:hypothetical protein A8C56_13650 [Niabella ginsenosidivorans]
MNSNCYSDFKHYTVPVCNRVEMREDMKRRGGSVSMSRIKEKSATLYVEPHPHEEKDSSRLDLRIARFRMFLQQEGLFFVCFIINLASIPGRGRQFELNKKFIIIPATTYCLCAGSRSAF